MAGPNPFATPQGAAVRLSQWLDACFSSSPGDRFPVDVPAIALGIGQQMNVADRIVQVQAFQAKAFEGGLFQIDPQKWALLYNDAGVSPRRVRFTQAHELGHFIVHRTLKTTFECSEGETAGWSDGNRNIEREADDFAANLLMPRTHFERKVAGNQIDFEAISSAADDFGVSLTAAALRWLRITNESAVLVSSNEGFINWSVSSDRALKNGAYFRTVGRPPIEVPAASIASDPMRPHARSGEPVALQTWFKYAHRDAVAREMKVQCDNHAFALSLLHLSPTDAAWPPRPIEEL